MNTVKVKQLEYETHDVIRLVLEKPTGITYSEGQAVDLSLPSDKNELRAFTFTSLPEDDFLEFIIKVYPKHHGVTLKLSKLQPNDEVIVHEPFGDISFKGNGVFIAGGAGITPFLAILKRLERKGNVSGNKLIFANKTAKDVILNRYFSNLLEKNYFSILSEEISEGNLYGYVSKELIQQAKTDSLKYVYVCGPEPMMQAVEKILDEMQIPKDYIVKEGF